MPLALMPTPQCANPPTSARDRARSRVASGRCGEAPSTLWPTTTISESGARGAPPPRAVPQRAGRGSGRRARRPGADAAAPPWRAKRNSGRAPGRRGHARPARVNSGPVAATSTRPIARPGVEVGPRACHHSGSVPGTAAGASDPAWPLLSQAVLAFCALTPLTAREGGQQQPGAEGHRDRVSTSRATASRPPLTRAEARAGS